MVRPIRLLAVSDVHGKVSKLKAAIEASAPRGVELITISGDISHFGRPPDVKYVLESVGGYGIPFCYVLGNCDPPEFDGSGAGGSYVDSRCEVVKGMAVTGAGGSTPTPFDTPFEMSEDELVRRIREGIAGCAAEAGPRRMMLLTHNPPLATTVDLTRTGAHVGSRLLRDLILEASPLLVQCGHIHEAAGVERLGGSLVVNPGSLLRDQYAIVDLNDGREPHVDLRTLG